MWPGAAPQPNPIAEFFLFEMPRPPAPRPSLLAPARRSPLPEVREQPAACASAAAPRPQPVVGAARGRRAAPRELAARGDAPAPAPDVIDFDEARQRAAEEVVTERSAEKRVPDVLDRRRRCRRGPSAEPEPERSIFDPGPRSRGPHRRATGSAANGFRRASERALQRADGRLQSHGLRQLLRRAPDEEPSGLFPEVRPAYLDLMPECVDTRDTAPQLALGKPVPDRQVPARQARRPRRANPKISRRL